MIRRKYLKQVMAFATAISMVLPQTAVYAEDMSAQQSNVEQTAQEQNEPVNTYDDDFLKSLPTPKTGYLDVEDDNIGLPDIVNKDVTNNSTIAYDRAATYPAKYKTESLPTVRDQGGYGVCWAFSTMSLLEINLLKKKLVTQDIDLSEFHLVNFTYDCVEDPLGGNAGDKNSFTASEDNKVTQMGGNVEMAVNSLMDWEGAVDESVLPYTYDIASKIDNREIDSSLAYSDTKAHLQSYYKINTTNKTDVKQAVTDYGAVSISYFTDSSYSTSKYFNSATAGYYCYDNTGHNHAVTIVGWDDNYSADNFVNKPEGDGAWIVRNSWGDYFGQGGYFYLSYYDVSISGTGYAVEAELSDNYDNNYQYDGTVWYNYAGYSTPKNTFANIFTAKANNGKAESIKAVSFETYQAANAGYNIKIYKNLSSMSQPQSGTLVAEKSGKLAFDGAYTIKLDTPIDINDGETFSVVVELTSANEGRGAYVIMDYSYDEGWFTCQSSAKANQSFIMDPYDGYWMDYGASTNCNFRIKAYTDNEEVVEEVKAESVSLDKTQVSLKEKETVKLNATVLQENADNKNVSYTSSDSTVATVNDEGLVTAVSAGEAIITVTTQDGNKTATCKVTVTKTVEPLAITATSQLSGNNYIFTANATGGTQDYTYKFIVYNRTTNKWGLVQAFSKNNVCSWKKGSAGVRDFYVDVKDSDGTVVRSKAMTITINTVIEPKPVLTASSSSIKIGDKITLKASGGDANCTYKVIVYNKKTKQWGKIQDYSKNTTINWTAGSDGDRQFFVDIKDANGKVTRSSATEVKVISYTINTNVTSKNGVYTFTANVPNAKGLTYKFIVYNKTTKKWGLVQNFSSKNVCTWKAGSAGDREFYIDVKDANGTVTRSSAINIK